MFRCKFIPVKGRVYCGGREINFPLFGIPDKLILYCIKSVKLLHMPDARSRCVEEAFVSDKKKVLVVDDMEMNVNLVKSFLTILGFDVLTASDGMAGLEVLKANPVDLVFSDVEMPNMNGFEFLRNIKKTNPSLPVIMLTTLDKQEHLDRAEKLGASAYIVKPFTAEKVKAALSKAGLA